ncbi:MAG: lysophospholipid acyltransferase family protein [Planctomycetota bacterium]
MPVLHTVLRPLVRHALRVYFRELELEGAEDVPRSGPLLLAPNHPNTLIDVLLVAAHLDRTLRFVAKATLFKGPAGPLLRALNAVPIARRQDGPQEEGVDNQQTLDACELAVAQGDAVLIFPEGVSQEEPRLMRLKTGLARIALGAQARTEEPVYVVPVALIYDARDTFRSRARVAFTPPIDVRPFAAQDTADDPFAPARALTTAVKDALEPEVVHVARPELDPLVAQLDRLYGQRVEHEIGGRLAATAAIARAVSAFAERDPERVAQVQAQLADYARALEAAGIDDRALRRQKAPRPQDDLAFWAAAPFAVWGAVNHLLYYQLPRFVVGVLGPERLYTSTVKLLVGLLALGLCYAGQTWGIYQLGGWYAAGPYLATLPLTGFIALLWLEALAARRRRRSVRRAARRLGPETRRALQAQREALVRELDRARVDYLADRLAEG